MIRQFSSIRRHKSLRQSNSRRGAGRHHWPWSFERLEDRLLLATFTVNSLLDTVDANPGDGIAEDASGATTLRAAIMEANALAENETIILPSGTYYLTLTGTNEDGAATGDLDILNNGIIQIIGDGADQTIIHAGGEVAQSIPALGDRVFEVLNGTTLSVEGVTVTGGNSTANGGGIQNFGALTVTNSTLAGNSTTASGGGILNAGTLTLTNSTLVGNSAGSAGGGIFNATRFPIIVGATTMTVTNSTFADNRAGGGGGIVNDEAVGTVSITNSTFTGNRADNAGGGLFISRGAVTLHNSIVAGNVGGAGATPDDVRGSVAGASSFNLIGVDTGLGGIGNNTNGNQVGAAANPIDPRLAPLADNGGPTMTHALLPGSPAINRGVPSFTAPPNFDQRGTGFDRVSGVRVDVGAFEVQVVDPAPVGNVIGPTTVDDVFDLTDGLWSLREAILFANDTAGDFEISLSASTYFLTIAGANENAGATGDLDILNGGVRIVGAGADQTIIHAGGDGNSIPPLSDRIFDVQSALELTGVTLTGGSSTGNGGGIQNFGALTVTNSTLAGNSTTASGGGILNAGTLTLTNSTLAGNSAGSAGGGIFNATRFPITVGATTMTVTNSTFADNNTAGSGGAIVNDEAVGTVNITNSTFTGNRANNEGGGLFISRGAVTLHNSIVAGNVGGIGATPNDIRGTVAAASSFNLIGVNTGLGGIGNNTNGNQVGAVANPIDPRLAPLVDNGGPTMTHALSENSPALDAGDPAFASPPNFDQRGTPFARKFGDRIDIGAYESQSLALVIDTTTDENDGDYSAGDLSLREAIELANANIGEDSITFDGALAGETITLTLGELSIDSSMTIIGLGADQLAVSGNNASRVFFIGGSPTVEISGLTIRDGRAHTGAGIWNSGILTLTDGIIIANVASGFGGGIFTQGTVTVRRTAISGNTRDGIFVTFGPVSVIDSTISGNSGMGIDSLTFGPLTLLNSTIANNSGGVLASNVMLRNTIIAGNAPTFPSADVQGNITSLGNNLIGKSDGISSWLATDLTGTIASPLDPRLGALADNGGLTPTHALLAGSPAIDAGNNTDAPATDQRGFTRIADGADLNTTQTIDIGAFEAHPSIEDITDKSTDEDTPLSFSFNVGDAALGIDSVTVSSSNATLVPNTAANLNIGGSGSTRMLGITPATGESGMSTITVTVSADGQSMTDTFVFTVNAVNDVPVANPQTITTEEDEAVSVTLGGSDANGDALTFSITAQPLHGTLSGTAPNLTYTPHLNYHGPDAFEFTANDGQATSAPATVSINVLSVNDAPVADPNGPYDTNLGEGITFDGTASFDIDATSGDSIVSYSWDIDNGAFVLAGATASLTAAEVDSLGVGTFTVALTVTDESGATNSASTTLTIGVLPPELTSLSITTPINEGGTATLSGEYTHDGRFDSHRLDFDWDGDDDYDETLTVVGGSFSVPHQYLDDDPTGTANDTYSVNVRLREDQAVDILFAGDPITVFWSELDAYELLALQNNDFDAVSSINNARSRSPLWPNGPQSDTGTASLTVRNVAPEILSLTITTPINEGGTTTLMGSYTDVGTQDTHELNIDWDDDGAYDQTIAVNGGSFSVGHTFLDDNPTGTATDMHNINVRLRDDDGQVLFDIFRPGSFGAEVITVQEREFDFYLQQAIDANDLLSIDSIGTASLLAGLPHYDQSMVSLTVNNVAPEILSLSINSSISEDEIAHLTGTIGDPGTLDEITLIVNWGDGSTNTALSSSDITKNATTGNWEFTADHAYTDAGQFTITAIVQDDDGDSSSDSTTVSVFDNRPFASFAANPNPAAPGQNVIFDASASTHGRPDRQIVSYSWDFGDGDTATGLTATHTYAAFGTYSVTLTVTDNNNPPQTGTASANVSVNQGNNPPVAVPNGPYLVDLGEGVALSSNGSFDPDVAAGDSIVSYSWDFDQGAFVLLGPNPSLEPAEIDQLLMIFGVGVEVPVRLTVTDSFGATGTATTTFAIYDNRPFASLTANPNPAAPAQAITFDASASSHGRSIDRDIVQYAFNFGDGTTYTESAMSAPDGLFDGKTTHSYGLFGTFTADVTVTDNNVPAKTDVATQVININQGNRAPTANPGGPYNVALGSGLTLDGSNSFDPDAAFGDSIVSYAWNIGSGAKMLNGVMPSLSAAEVDALGSGSFTVVLIVTDEFGATGTSQTVLNINDGTAPTFTSVPNDVVAEATGGDGAVVTYAQATATDDVDDPADIPIVYSHASGSQFPLGTTTVLVSATDAAGNSSQATFDITVVDTNAPALTIPTDITVEATSPAGAIITFAATATDAVDADPTITHIPASGSQFPLGVITVNVTATDDAGNASTGSFTVTVVDPTPSGPITTVNVVNGQLVIEGDDGINTVTITGVGTGTGVYDITTEQGTQRFSGVTAGVSINLGGGGDELVLNNVYVAGSIDIQTGDGDDTVVLGDVNPVSSAGDLTIDLGAGNDVLDGLRLYIGLNQFINGGDGDDRLIFDGFASPQFTLGTSAAGNVAWSGGSGNDTVHVIYGFIVGAWVIDLGVGDDSLSVFGSAVSGDVIFLGGSEADSLQVDTNFFDANLRIEAGDGSDSVLLANGLGTEVAIIQTHELGDNVMVRNQTTAQLQVNTGGGDDDVNVTSSLLDHFFAALGDGNDRLTVRGNLLRFSADWDGGAGGDQLADLGNNIRGLSQRRNFEAAG